MRWKALVRSAAQSTVARKKGLRTAVRKHRIACHDGLTHTAQRRTQLRAPRGVGQSGNTSVGGVAPVVVVRRRTALCRGSLYVVHLHGHVASQEPMSTRSTFDGTVQPRAERTALRCRENHTRASAHATKWSAGRHWRHRVVHTTRVHRIRTEHSGITRGGKGGRDDATGGLIWARAEVKKT